MTLSDEEIVQYLRDHPGFFEEYGSMLADMQIPQPHGGGAIPITERQIVALREKNRTLQKKLSELIRFGEENGALVEKMHRFAVALLVCRRLDGLLSTFEFHLREDFAVAHVGLRVWNMTSGHSALPQFARTGADIHQLAESLSHPYCGHHVVDEIKHWFGEARFGCARSPWCLYGRRKVCVVCWCWRVRIRSGFIRKWAPSIWLSWGNSWVPHWSDSCWPMSPDSSNLSRTAHGIG